MDVKQFIEEAWSKYPGAVVKFSVLSKGQAKPRIKSLPKNEMHIYVRNGKTQRVYVYKGALRMDMTYTRGNTIENSTKDELTRLMVLPSTDHTHTCNDCREFSVSMYISRKDKRLLCIDCFKAEKDRIENEGEVYAKPDH